MKSYKDHLLSTASDLKPGIVSARKPVYRSSAIFPVMESDAIHTKVLFMGYWFVKRNIMQLGYLISLRDELGRLIYRKNETLTSAKAYEICIADLLKQIEYSSSNFIGSIELEIFSAVDLVYPYPAFVVNYYNEHGSGLVHTTGRIYNDFEDLFANESIRVRESGFDVFPGTDYNPFFAFVNGNLPTVNALLNIELINHQGEMMSKEVKLGTLDKLQTIFLKLNEYFDKEAFLEGQPGTVKITHNLSGFFPRFIAGNLCEKNSAVAITHTYYDNSENHGDADYWTNSNPELLHDSAIFVPVYIDQDWYTQVKLYPIYSPSNHSINLRFYDEEGNILLELKNYLEIHENQIDYITLDVQECIKDAQVDKSKIAGLLIYKDWQDKTKIPTRLKYGLNIGRKNLEYDMPTNICFNSMLSNMATVEKKGSFRWMPLTNRNESVVVIHNSSFCKEYQREARIHVNFYNTHSEEAIKKDFIIPPYGQIRITVDEELSNFFGADSGWCTIQSENPFVNGWYFEFNDSGIMGGDHTF
jgi:hypothetical protein